MARPTTKPPPIPPAAIAPSGMTTDLGTPVTGEATHDTHNTEVADSAAVIEQMLSLVADEAEALLAGDSQRLADLNVRSALVSWDTTRQADDALRLLDLADGHPLTPRLRVQAALEIAAPDALVAVEAALGRPLPRSLALELAEAWLWRHRNAERAAAIADRLLADSAMTPELPHIGELAALAHNKLRNWARVAEVRRGYAKTAEEVAAIAALQLDRSANPATALATCDRAIADPDFAVATPLGRLRVLDIAIDAAPRGEPRRRELLEQRAQLVAKLPNGELEALATRHMIATELERSGERDAAAAMWIALADEPVAQQPKAARRIALLGAAWLGERSGAAAALVARRKLADSECSEVATAHVWRALELAASINDPAVDDLARAVNDVASGIAAERWLDELELVRDASDPASPREADGGLAAIARFEGRGGLAVRWAAAIAERRGERAKALQLWARVANAQQPGAIPSLARDHIVRLQRAIASAQDVTGVRSASAEPESGLAHAYAAAAAAEQRDPRAASALWCAAGVVDLARGALHGAEEALGRARELAPDDVFCRAALAATYRAGRRHEPLARVLGELATLLDSADGRATAARESAELLAETGDRAGARAALERLISEHPDDADSVLALARLYELDDKWARAIELRTQAIEHVATDERRAELWHDIARAHERRDDREAAQAALARAARLGSSAAAREQARLFRESGDLERALTVVRDELATEPPLGRRMQLLNHQAQLLGELDREPAVVVASYLEILGIEPDQTEALAGIEEPARKLALWDELARAFRGAPRTPHNLDVLAEALTHIAEWSELAEVRRRQLEVATTPSERARRAGELAALYARELGDRDAAIRMLELAVATNAADDAVAGELRRLLRDAERWPELASALERAVTGQARGQRGPNELVDDLLELGELRTRLGQPAEAILAYEAALDRRPGDATALAALEPLYERAGRERELARVIEQRAEATTEPKQRAELLARVAQLRANRSDIDGAIATYLAAFAADPTNRDVFTAMERVCYKAERWAAVMQLYEAAIRVVEAGNSRAYRLGDLYARRGNVQLKSLGQIAQAIESYQKVVEVDSQPAHAVTALEELCRRTSDWRPLIAAFEKRGETQRDPQRRAEALRTAARLADQHGEPRLSVQIARKLLTVDPKDKDARARVERFYEEHSDATGLLDILRAELATAESTDDRVAILKRIGRASEEGARDVVSATDHYNKVLELRADDRDALDALARIYESTEQWADYLDVTRKLIQVTNDRAIRALLYFRCGSVLEAKFSREQDAIRYYHRAIETSAACLPAVHGLRDLYRRREEWPRVIETLELEVKLWTDDNERAGVLAQIGRIYEKQLDDVERARQFYDSALAVDPDCLLANQGLFEYHFERRDWQAAAPIATALAQKAMRDGEPATRSEFFRKRGLVARMTGDLRNAADSIVYALEVRPTNLAALDDLNALARDQPDAWDFESTYKELDKLYRKRDDSDPLLARVHIGRAAFIERAGEIDQASALYRQAIELAPGDLTVLDAVVTFHTDMRHWNSAIAALERFIAAPGTSQADRISALLRRAEIHADGEMDPGRAIAALREVIQLDPLHQEAYYQLAQQFFLAARFADARTAIDRVIELATAPGRALEAPSLARYYYYKGRIVEAAGDPRSAASQYRRATDYDPGYAPPALVLARRAAEAGDPRGAETMLVEAAHAAMEQSGVNAAVPLQRGLARILLGSGDRRAAIDAYRGILNVDPEGASDRVALAEIYAVEEPPRAINELRKVLERDIHHAPAYRLLATFHNRIGETERATRVLIALDLLGFAEDADRNTLQRLRGALRTDPFARTLDSAARTHYLLTPAARTPVSEVFEALAEPLSLIAQPSLGTNLQPALAGGTGIDRLLALAGEIATLYEVEPEIFVADRVPGLAAVTAFPRKLLVVDRSLLDEPDDALRFLLGYAFESIRGHYSLLLQMGARQRRELLQLLRAVLAGDADMPGPAATLVERAGLAAREVIDRHAGARNLDPQAWCDGMLALAKRAGLLACNDFRSAIWMVARLSGERLANHDQTVALGAVLGGSDLVRFYLSDDYQHLRDLLMA